MLPVVDASGYWSAIEAVVTAALLIPITLLPIGEMPVWVAVVYSLVSLGLGGAYLWASVRFLKERSEPVARRLLRVSLLYLPLMMLAMVLAAWGQSA